LLNNQEKETPFKVVHFSIQRLARVLQDSNWILVDALPNTINDSKS